MPIVTAANNWTVGLKKQSAEGSANVTTVAAYEFPIYSGRPMPVQNIARVEVTDNASIVGDPYKQSGEHWESTVEFPAFANVLGAVLQSMWPTDAATGAGTASSKTITAASVTSTTATFTSATHGFSNADYVLVTGMTPATYNGLWLISNVAANTFDVVGFLAGLGAGTAFGTAVKVPYAHTFSGLGTVAQPWYTMYQTAPGSMLETYESGICSSVGFSFDETGGPLHIQWKMVGEKPTKAAHTITTSAALTDGFFTATAGTLKVSESAGTPSAATNIQKATVTVDRNATALATADGTTVAFLGQGKVDPSFTATLLYADWNAYQATFYGSTSGTSASSTIVKGSLELNFVHSVQAGWGFKLLIPSAVFAADPPTPDASGSPLTVNIKGYATKPSSGDHVQPTLANGVSTAY